MILPKIAKLSMIAVVAGFAITLSACDPEVGSPDWCTNLKEKPKGDWTANEATDFAKNCIL